MNRLRLIGLVVTVALVVGVLIFVWEWGVCRKYCDVGESLLIQNRMGSTSAAKDGFAEPEQKGVLEQMPSVGRHFYNPITYLVQKVANVTVPPGEIRVLVCKTGKELPKDRFLADEGEKGVMKKVLTPGEWRINPYGFDVEKRPETQEATLIPPGYVGVQMLRAGPKKGVLDEVLPAGYYNINPEEIRVDIVEIGYRELTIMCEYGRDGKITDGSGVSFPLADGKQMHLDFTVVWGIFPENAPRIIREFGTIDMVETKIIEPQVTSICKNNGSNLTTQQFIEGQTREEFQEAVIGDLKALGVEKGIHFLVALVRGFHPDEDIRNTIRKRRIAEEEKQTLAIEMLTDTVSAELEMARRKVEVIISDFDAETEALVRSEEEMGNKEAAEIKAEADREVAALAKETAETEAKIVKVMGQAEADVVEADKKADAMELQLLIDAYGDSAYYNMAQFAENLPEDLRLEYRYAGEGTFWTDAKSGLVDMAARKMLDALQKPTGRGRPTSGRSGSRRIVPTPVK